MRLLLPLLTLLIVAATHARADDWSGAWDTRWRDGGARLELRQQGDAVQGRYAAYDGTLEGRVDGRSFRGRWQQGPRSGGFDFVMSADGKSFVGRYESGEWWTGARASGEAASAKVDLSTPRAAMRTFLRGGNAARYDAPDELIKSVAAVEFGDADPLPEVKLARTRALFDLVDATYFRIFSVPDDAAGDAVAVTLTQAGTGVELPLRFARRGDAWRIVMPDEATFARLAKALYARSGGQPPGPEDYKLRRTASDAYRAFTHAFYEWDRGGRDGALAALDLSALPAATRDYEGELAAQYLGGILSRVGLLEPQEIPDDANATQPFVLFSHAAGQIVLAPVGTAKPATWAFTRETVRNARRLFVVVEDLPPVPGWALPRPESGYFSLRERIRAHAPSLLTDLGAMELWQALGWAATLAIALGLGLLATEVAMVALRRAFRAAGSEPHPSLRYPVWGALAFSIYKLIIPVIGIEGVAKQISVGVTGVLLVASLVWLGWFLIDAVGASFFRERRGGRVSMDNIVVLLLLGFLKLALLMTGLVLIAVELSLPYEGIIASLSIGGLAVAFASRETLSNIFGAGVLAIDRPFKRGDQISAGGVDGTVEDVGIRSTRVRTADDSVIIIPNGKLSDAFVNNLGSRRYHAASLKVPVAWSTGAAGIEALMSGTRALVDAIPEIAPHKTTLALTPNGRDGLQLAVGFSFDTRRGGSEVALTNALVLDILKLCERLGVRTALPVAA